MNLNENEGFLRLMKSYVSTAKDKKKAIETLKNILDKWDDN
tara:strand:+ start:785 stop:907 length:123 start_codon:yes stop_codon:yes gene_type:complete